MQIFFGNKTLTVLQREDMTVAHCRLRSYELLYLWNVFSSCSVENLNTIYTGKILNELSNVLSLWYLARCCQNGAILPTDCDCMRLSPDLSALAKLTAGVALDYLEKTQESLMLLQESVTIWRAPRVVEELMMSQGTTG